MRVIVQASLHENDKIVEPRLGSKVGFSDISVGSGGLFSQREPDGFTSVGKLSSGRLEGNGFSPYVL